MHEQTVTVRGPNGAWYNVYGVSHAGLRGTPVKPIYKFERTEYPNREAAVAAAALRSRLSREPKSTRPTRDPFPSTVSLEDILSFFLQSIGQKKP